MKTASLIFISMAFNLYDPNTPVIKKPISRKNLDLVKKILVYISFATLLVLLAMIIVTVWPSKPSLTIKAGVESEFVVDGKQIGSGTMVGLANIEVGRHEIVAIPKEKIPFMTKDTQRVDIAPGKSETIELVSISSVEFKSKPDKASIIISSLDGDLNLGKTPLKTKLPYGQYEVTMRLPGFPEYSRSFLSSGAEDLVVSTDFDSLALDQPGSRKLTYNLLVTKLREGAMLKVDGKEYNAGDQVLLPSGFHNVCMFSYGYQILCTQVMFPSVGKPVEISWPDSIDYPCMYFGKDLYTLPNDARYTTVTQDGSSLVYATGQSQIDCIDLITGQESWVEKVDRAFNLRPVIMSGTDANYIYGMAGVPSDVKSTPFCLEVKSGSEKDISTTFSGSVLPMSATSYKSGQWQCYANVWSTIVNGEGYVKAIEAVVVKGAETSRYIKELESDESASFLGVSMSATTDNHPIFIFSYKNAGNSKLLILDPTIAVPYKQVEYKEWNKEKFTMLMEPPKPEDRDKGWIFLNSPFETNGACYDGGFDTGNAFIVYSDFTVASISYPDGRLKWSRYIDKVRKTSPSISQAKGKNVVILSYPSSPFEYRLDVKTGEILERRTRALIPEEAILGTACPGGSFIISNNTVVSGVKMDENGKFKPTWKRTFKEGLLLASPWGPVYINKGKIDVLGSHMLSPVLSFNLPGLGLPNTGSVYGDKYNLAIYVDSRVWIVDRDGLIKGYFTGIDKLSPLESSGHKALLAEIDDKKVVIPWPKN